MNIRIASSLLVALAASCATGPNLVMDPALEEGLRQRDAVNAQRLARQKEFRRVLLNLDKTMDKYSEAVAKSGLKRADHIRVSLDQFLRKTVGDYFDQLVVTADDASEPGNQAIAAAALGFSERPEALDPLLNAIRSESPAVVTNAAFALGMLKDRRTPPDVLVDVVEDPKYEPKMRAGAAWSLLQVQSAIQTPERVTPVWLRLVSNPNTAAVDPWVRVQALRGVGRSRNPLHAPLVEPFLSDPTPLVRTAAATALGYLGNRDAHEALLERLGPVETNPTVRLAVRKALQALAGSLDRGYDVKEWRRVFESKRNG